MSDVLTRSYPARKCWLLIGVDWGIAAVALTMVGLLHRSDSLLVLLVSVTALGVGAVAFVGAPVIAWRRSQRPVWLALFPIVALIAAGLLLGRAEYHHVQSVRAETKFRKAETASGEVTKHIALPKRVTKHDYIFRAPLVDAYEASFAKAAPDLARLHIRLIRFVEEPFLPGADMTVGAVSFCYVPYVPTPYPLLGTCETPDYETMSHIRFFTG